MMPATWRLVACAVLLCAFTSCDKTVPPPPSTPTPTPSPTAAPSATPTPIPSIGRKPLDTAKLFNGLTLQTKLLTPLTDSRASLDRENPGNYTVEITVNASIPKASQSIEELAENDPKLPLILNKSSRLFRDANVSPFYGKLYELKTSALKEKLARLDQLMTRHNFYDCETILEIKDDDTGRKVLLIQGDMDVNTDGSDGDRNVTVDGSSQFFQPQTSYRWPKQTERPNPFLATAEKKLASHKSEYSQKGLSADRNRELKDDIEEGTRLVYDLEHSSFLISDSDPFIVVPGFMLRQKDNPFSPQIGDYAVVIHKGQVYPAIIGDAGPSFKVGEASMRLCRELNAKSSANSRPVSDLKVSYLVFPGTADPKPGPPDLEKMRARCSDLLNEIGGIAPELHTWENLVKPWPTPTPSPTPTPTPSPTPSPTAAPETSPTPATLTSPTEISAPTPPPSDEPTVETSPAPSSVPEVVTPGH